MDKFKKILIVLLLVISAPFISGYIFMKLWNWIILPIFEVNNILFIEALGIMLFVNFITYRGIKSKNIEDKDFWKGMLEAVMSIVISGGVALIFGKIISIYI